MENLITCIKKIQDVNIYTNNNLLLYEYLINNELYKSEIVCLFILKNQNLELVVTKDSNVKISEYIKDIDYSYCYNNCLIYLDVTKNLDINLEFDFNILMDYNAHKIYSYLIDSNKEINFFDVLNLAIKKNNKTFFNITITKYKPTYYHINNILLYERNEFLKILLELGYIIQEDFYTSTDYTPNKNINNLGLLINSNVLKNSEENFMSTFENIEILDLKTKNKKFTLSEPYIDIIYYNNKIYNNYDFDEIFKTGKYKNKKIDKILDDSILIHRTTCKRLGILHENNLTFEKENYIEIYDSIFNDIIPSVETYKLVYPEFEKIYKSDASEQDMINILKILYVDCCKTKFENICILKNNL